MSKNIQKQGKNYHYIGHNIANLNNYCTCSNNLLVTGLKTTFYTFVWFEKISMPTPWEVIGNSEREEWGTGVEGSQKPNILKKSMKLNSVWIFWRGERFKPKNLPWGR